MIPVFIVFAITAAVSWKIANGRSGWKRNTVAFASALVGGIIISILWSLVISDIEFVRFGTSAAGLGGVTGVMMARRKADSQN